LDKAPNPAERREYKRLLVAAERERMGRKRRIDVDLQQKTLLEKCKLEQIHACGTL